MDSMVVTWLSGGLGNQMFQYACGKALALRYNKKLQLDLDWFDKEGNRPFQLDIFNCDIKRCSDKDILNIKKAGKIERYIKRYIKGVNYIHEKGMDYLGPLDIAGEITYLQGCWQSEKYFIDVADVIRNDFSLAQKLDEKNSMWKKRIEKSDNSVALHVRRGDYVTVAANKSIYKEIPIAYYQECLAELQDKLGKITIFVFSNDMDWVRKNIHTDQEMFYVDCNDENHGYMDMYLMSRCQHNIIANSTFSWWGAWLNANSSKIIYTPDMWFNDEKMNKNEILPESWRKVKV